MIRFAQTGMGTISAIIILSGYATGSSPRSAVSDPVSWWHGGDGQGPGASRRELGSAEGASTQVDSCCIDNLAYKLSLFLLASPHNSSPQEDLNLIAPALTRDFFISFSSNPPNLEYIESKLLFCHLGSSSRVFMVFSTMNSVLSSLLNLLSCMANVTRPVIDAVITDVTIVDIMLIMAFST